jgi:nucleoside-diphosphate-sugar epimerase
MSKNKELILVTGASGFVALHVINKFIKEGYKVRGTVRSLKDESKLAPIRRLGTKDNLELVEADLLNENSWAEAMKGVTRVIHVASPFPMVSPSDENQLIKPAVEGTRNVLTAAFKANVQRVVVTSSTAAIIDFYEESQKNYNYNLFEIKNISREICMGLCS